MKSPYHILQLILFFFILAVLPVSVHAQTPVSNAVANEYIANCKKQPGNGMSLETQDIFCNCTALHMQQSLSIEDMRAMREGGDTARQATNKMLTQVYAPCMEFPVRDLIYNKCLKDAYQAGERICSCMASKMATYTAQQAAAQLESVLRHSPNAFDPMKAIVESNGFQKHEKKIVLQCIQEKMNRR